MLNDGDGKLVATLLADAWPVLVAGRGSERNHVILGLETSLGFGVGPAFERTASTIASSTWGLHELDWNFP